MTGLNFRDIFALKFNFLRKPPKIMIVNIRHAVIYNIE